MVGCLRSGSEACATSSNATGSRFETFAISARTSLIDSDWCVPLGGHGDGGVYGVDPASFEMGG